MDILSKNEFVIKQTDGLFKRLEEVCSRENPPFVAEKFVMKSETVNLNQDTDAILLDIERAKRSLELIIWAVKRLGIKIIPLQVEWCNVLDSDYNIFGDKGFLILRYNLHKL